MTDTSAQGAAISRAIATVAAIFGRRRTQHRTDTALGRLDEQTRRDIGLWSLSLCGVGQLDGWIVKAQARMMSPVVLGR